MFAKCISYTCPIRVYCYRGKSLERGGTLIKGEYNKVTGCDYFIKLNRK